MDYKSHLADVTLPDGNLFSLGWYLSYKKGKDTAVLDGDFTADDLIAIGEYMKETQNETQEPSRG